CAFYFSFSCPSVLSDCLLPYHSLLIFLFFSFSLLCPPPISTLFPYTTLFRSDVVAAGIEAAKPFIAELCAAQQAVVETSACCARSEEHTSELQSRFDLVCRLLLEKKNYHHDVRYDQLGDRRV